MPNAILWTSRMASGKEDLKIAGDALRKLLDDQLASIDGLSSKVSVVLGFVVSTIGIVFSIGRATLLSNPPLTVLIVILLLGAAILLVLSYNVSKYFDSPQPEGLLDILNDPKVTTIDLLTELVSNYSGAYLANSKLIEQKFNRLNVALIMLVAGIAVFAIEVLI